MHTLSQVPGGDLGKLKIYLNDAAGVFDDPSPSDFLGKITAWAQEKVTRNLWQQGAGIAQGYKADDVTLVAAVVDDVLPDLPGRVPETMHRANELGARVREWQRQTGFDQYPPLPRGSSNSSRSSSRL